MGGCVGTQRGNGGRGSRRPSAFSDSTSSGLHGGTATKNRPLRHEKIRWKSDIPLTDGQLKSKRDEFVFRMKLTGKEETDILSQRVEKLEKKINTLEKKLSKKTKKGK